MSGRFTLPQAPSAVDKRRPRTAQTARAPSTPSAAACHRDQNQPYGPRHEPSASLQHRPAIQSFALYATRDVSWRRSVARQFGHSSGAGSRAANQKWQSMQRRFTMPGNGCQGVAARQRFCGAVSNAFGRNVSAAPEHPRWPLRRSIPADAACSPKAAGDRRRGSAGRRGSKDQSPEPVFVSVSHGASLGAGRNRC